MALLPHLQQHWACIAVVSLSLFTLFDSLQGGIFHSLLTSPDDSMDKDSNIALTYSIAYSFLAINIAIDIQRIHIAFRPSTRNTQFAFNLWLVGAVVCYFLIVLGEVICYFIPMLESNHNTAIEHTWIHNHPWTAFALHMQLGYGLKALLNQRRQLDLEQERQQEYMRQQGYHQPLMDNKDLLPSPVMLTSLKEGFKTEAEQLRLRSRVSTWPRFLVAIWFLWLAIKGVNHFLHLSEHRSGQEIIQLTFSLAQGVAGLYILYRKSLALTQWLFYSICASTVYQAFTISRDIWKTDYKQSWMDYYSGVDEDEFEGISAFKDMADNLTPGEVVCIRIMFILGVTLFFVSRVWVAWRLVTDLKERDARIARAKEIQGRVGAEKVIVG